MELLRNPFRNFPTSKRSAGICRPIWSSTRDSERERDSAHTPFPKRAKICKAHPVQEDELLATSPVFQNVFSFRLLFQLNDNRALDGYPEVGLSSVILQVWDENLRCSVSGRMQFTIDWNLFTHTQENYGMSGLIYLFLFYCFGEIVIEFKRVRTINPEPELLLDSHVR